MSNGVVSTGCCCNSESCASQCCDWWSCSPTGPINVSLSASAITNKKILPGTQTLLIEEIHWTVTATLTRSGSTCVVAEAGIAPFNALYRYSAQTCNFSYQKKIYLRDVGQSYTCWQLPWAPLQCGSRTEIGDCVTYGSPNSEFSATYAGLMSLCVNGNPPCGFYWTCPQPGGCTSTSVPGAQCVPCGINSSLGNLGTCQDFFDANGYWPEPSPRTGPNPCLSWNCGTAADSNDACSGAGCEGIECPQSPDQIDFRLLETREFTYNGQLTAGGSSCGPGECPPDFGSCPNSIPGPPPFLVGSPSIFVRPGDVITIVCVGTQCKADAQCVKPVLIFSPDTTDKFFDSIYDRTMDPCCPWPCGEPENCVVELQTPFCIRPFAIFGKSNCLNSSTFDSPINGCSMHPSPLYGFGVDGIDMAGVGCSPCQPLEQVLEFPPYCNGGSNDPNNQGDSPYFCAVENAGDPYCPQGSICSCTPNSAVFCPPSCSSSGVAPYTVRRCYWPGWCEVEERTTSWGWSM